ncbi:MAG TPA: Verru_Chthon cassette protein A, partial [Prosthecobacter sp.]
YEKSTPTVTGGGGSVTYNEVVLPTEAGQNPNRLRLPMPVEWIYVLEDGTTGALDAAGTFVSSEAAIQPSATNPIVGRIAFWTDDESSKININTASEPTFFAPPYFYHKRDSQWANFPGSGSEYQRYPGHPATVALSAVLAPGLNLDPMAQGVNVDNIVEIKENIYDLIPKIGVGGSKSGTRPFVLDDFSAGNGEEPPAQMVDTTASRLERLFASVDEMLFKDGAFTPATGREAARYAMPGGDGKVLFDHDTLERSRFFLTAHSRSPDFSSSGLPRISMWPVADEGRGPDYRTNFDNMIALCSTLGSGATGSQIAKSYIFRRAQAHHATHDVTGSSSSFAPSQGLRRNSQLLDYLYAQMTGLDFPATSALGASRNFGTKYGVDNAAQLCVQFFDYIRSTNLYDGVLARENDGIDGESPTSTALYTLNDNKEGTYRTYTNHRVSRKASGNINDGTQTRLGNDVLSDDAKVFPGHGQVTPAVWQKGSNSYRGFGRMFTLSEVGFNFICTADGKNDEFARNTNGVLSGGGSAPRVDPTLETGRPGDPSYGAEVDPV